MSTLSITCLISAAVHTLQHGRYAIEGLSQLQVETTHADASVEQNYMNILFRNVKYVRVHNQRLVKTPQGLQTSQSGNLPSLRPFH